MVKSCLGVHSDGAFLPLGGCCLAGVVPWQGCPCPLSIPLLGDTASVDIRYFGANLGPVWEILVFLGKFKVGLGKIAPLSWDSYFWYHVSEHVSFPSKNWPIL